jgi:hypothetical protein
MTSTVLQRTLLVALLTTTSAIWGQKLTQLERDHATQYLESTKDNVVAATKGLSEAQWQFKSAPDRWSIAEVMEHIAASEDFIRDGLLKDKVMVSPTGSSDRDVKKIDDAVLAMIPDRTHKAQAPDPLKPQNRFGSPSASLQHFLDSRAVTEQYLVATNGLRDHVMDGPVGKMDGYEFILFIAAHSARHTKQIEEVKADPNFPKD